MDDIRSILGATSSERNGFLTTDHLEGLLDVRFPAGVFLGSFNAPTREVLSILSSCKDFFTGAIVRNIL